MVVMHTVEPKNWDDDQKGIINIVEDHFAYTFAHVEKDEYNTFVRCTINKVITKDEWYELWDELNEYTFVKVSLCSYVSKKVTENNTVVQVEYSNSF